jgi:hypothetical protein
MRTNELFETLQNLLILSLILFTILVGMAIGTLVTAIIGFLAQ